MRPALALLALAWAGAAWPQLYSLRAEGGDLVGQLQTLTVTDEETLADVARDHKIGHEEIRLVNPEVDFWLLTPGTRVLLPKQHVLPRARREGLVLNVPEMRLYYFPRPCDGETGCSVATYPVSIGRRDWETPLGSARVTRKVANPTWTPPESVRREAEADGRWLPTVVPPGPDNPLGAHALYLDLPGYWIHGTNRPYGIGMRVTHGCVRMYPEDIESLFAQVDVGTRVQIVNQPVKFGWSGDSLYAEAHPPLEEDGSDPAALKDAALARLEEIATQRPFELDGRAFRRALEEQRGIPLAIGRAADSPAD